MDYLKNLPNYITELFTKIARENGFEKFTVHANLGSKPGDGFGGEILSITISDDVKSDRKLDLICKIGPFSRNRRKEMSTSLFFRNEALWYEQIEPMFAKFQAEKKLSPNDQFRCTPKCYATLIDDENEQYVIVLEDLRPMKFEMWNKANVASIENLRMTLCELGKLHGLSIAIRDQCPAEFEKIKQIQNGRLELARSEVMQSVARDMLDRTIDSLEREEHKRIGRHLKNIELPVCLGKYFDDGAKSGFGVLCHGDCWNNNIMYQFNERGFATDIRFLDWQLICYASPSMDLAFYLFSNTDQSLRNAEYDNLLAFYHESLAKMVKLLGSDPDKLFTFNDLKSELKKCGEYALLMAPVGLLLTQADSNNPIELNSEFENISEGGGVQFVSGLSADSQREYNRRLNELYEDIVKYGYITI